MRTRWKLSLVVLLLLGVATGYLACGGPALLVIREPVYNVAISPTVQRTAPIAGRQVVVRSGTTSTLSFGIGPRWSNSVVPPQTPNPEIVDSQTDVALTAVLACSFCEEHSAFVRKVVYRAQERESNVATFPVVPRQPTAAEPDGFDGTIELSVYGDAKEQQYDRVIVPVRVVRDGQLIEAGPPPVQPSPFNAPVGAPLDADVALRFYVDTDHLLVEINPLLPALQAQLDAIVQDSAGRLRSFRTAVMSQEDIAKITTGSYARTTAVSVQGDVAKQLSRPGTKPIVSDQSRTSLKLTALEGANLTAIIGGTGRTLYRRLFVDGPDGRELSNAIDVLERAEDSLKLGRPLRLHVRSDTVTLPWQYLVPIGQAPVDPTTFWGMRFDLSAERVNNGAPAMGPPESAQSNVIVFARHGSQTDQTVPLAQKQINQLTQMPAHVTPVQSGSDFLKELQVDRSKVSAVVTFLHASTTQDPEGPVILFGDQDKVTADELDGLPNAQSVADRLAHPRYLSASPLFVLNACETGPSTIAVPHTTFEEAAFRLGAQGIVVTEVSVWVNLGHSVGTKLLARLGNGEPVSHALAEVRRELRRDGNNPLGLFYAYYGDPGATLRR